MVGEFGKAEQEGGTDLVFNEVALHPTGQVRKRVKKKSKGS